MELGKENRVIVTRPEARVVRAAATMLGRMDIVTVCGHYAGMRMNRHSGQQGRLLLALREKNTPINKEVHGLEKRIERRNRSIEGIRYIYGPLFALEAMTTVREAVRDGLLHDVRQSEEGPVQTKGSRQNIALAHEMLIQYAAINPEFEYQTQADAQIDLPETI